MPAAPHPWARRYLNRCVTRQTAATTAKAGAVAAEASLNKPRGRGYYSLEGYERQQRCIASLLGGTLDETFQRHSTCAMAALLEAPEAKTPAVAVSTPAAQHIPCKANPRVHRGSVIRGEPSARDITDAISRYIFERKDNLATLHAKWTSACSLTDHDRDPYAHVLSTVDAVLTSVVRLSVVHATFVAAGATSGRGAAATTANALPEVPTVYSLRGIRASLAPSLIAADAGSWDVVAGSRHMLETLNLPACRARLQRFHWPTAARLHQSMLARVDEIFYRPASCAHPRSLVDAGAESDRELTADGKAFLAAAGCHEGVARLKEELFSFPQEMFCVVRPLEKSEHPGLTPTDELQLRRSRRNYEVFVPAKGRGAQNTFAVRSAKLVSAMGAVPREAFLAAETAQGANLLSAHERVTSQAAEDDSVPTPRIRLWFLMAEMTELRILVAYLLLVELTLHQVRQVCQQVEEQMKAPAREDTARGMLQNAVDLAIVQTAARVVELTRQPTYSMLRSSSHRFPLRASITLHPDAALCEGCGDGSTVDPLPERYTSVTQLYNCLAKRLRAQSVGPATQART